MMNRLTEKEIELLCKPRNTSTGVDAITREMLLEIDLDEVQVVAYGMNELTGCKTIETPDGKELYYLDDFIPKAGSYAFKPSFAGSQILMGRIGRRVLFTDGRWFVS